VGCTAATSLVSVDTCPPRDPTPGDTACPACHAMPEWHHRGARRTCAADSVHCRPYANPRVECPRWVGLTEGAAPSACDQNDCRKESNRTHPRSPDSPRGRARDLDRTTALIGYATNAEFGSVGPAPTILRPLVPTRHRPVPNGKAGRAVCARRDECATNYCRRSTLLRGGRDPSVRRWCRSGRQLSSTHAPASAVQNSISETGRARFQAPLGFPAQSAAIYAPAQPRAPQFPTRRTWSRRHYPAGSMRSFPNH